LTLEESKQGGKQEYDWPTADEKARSNILTQRDNQVSGCRAQLGVIQEEPQERMDIKQQPHGM
jgi:hypothetical protein